MEPLKYPTTIDELGANLRQSSLPGHVRLLLLANFGEPIATQEVLLRVLEQKPKAEADALRAEIFRVLGLTPTTPPEDL